MRRGGPRPPLPGGAPLAAHRVVVLALGRRGRVAPLDADAVVLRMLDPGRFCSTAQPGVTVAALQVMMTAPVRSTGAWRSMIAKRSWTRPSGKSFSAGRIVLEVVSAAGADGFAGVARRHAGAPCRAGGAPLRGVRSGRRAQVGRCGGKPAGSAGFAEGASVCPMPVHRVRAPRIGRRHGKGLPSAPGRRAAFARLGSGGGRARSSGRLPLLPPERTAARRPSSWCPLLEPVRQGNDLFRNGLHTRGERRPGPPPPEAADRHSISFV